MLLMNVRQPRALSFGTTNKKWKSLVFSSSSYAGRTWLLRLDPDLSRSSTVRLKNMMCLLASCGIASGRLPMWQLLGPKRNSELLWILGSQHDDRGSHFTSATGPQISQTNSN